MNPIDEAKAEALRQEGVWRERARLRDLISKLDCGCPPNADCPKETDCEECMMKYLTPEDSR